MDKTQKVEYYISQGKKFSQEFIGKHYFKKKF